MENEDLIKEAARLYNEEFKSWPKIKKELNLPWSVGHIASLAKKLYPEILEKESTKPLLIAEARRLRKEENLSWQKIKDQLKLPWSTRHISRLVEQWKKEDPPPT